MSAKRNFDQSIADLKAEERPPRVSLQGFSDLNSAQVARLRGVWSGLSVERRRWVARTLTELVEDNFELDFAAVFQSILSDPDAEVRKTAVEGLWENDDLAVADTLLAMLDGDVDLGVRAAAASALGHFVYLAEMEELPEDAARRIRQGLLDTIHGDQPLEVRRRAVEAIGFLSADKEVTEAIAEAYRDPHEDMRTSAVFAMGRNCDTRWLPDLMHELESEDPQMRFEAARACGELEDRRAVPRLMRLLVDPDLEVRLTTIQALGMIGGEQAIQALRYLSESEDQTIAEAAEEALAEAEFADSFLAFDLEEEPKEE